MTSPHSTTQIIMIDNYDSFTYNLVDQFRRLSAEVIVYRNDTPLDAIFTPERLRHENLVIVLSPGPGTPDSAGNTLDIIERFVGQLPILGICLGHQAIVQKLGGRVGQAQQIVHGKADNIVTSQHPVFANLPSPLRAARYHSLAAIELPPSLETIAQTTDEVMAIQHRTEKILGFQFHPESILTTYGEALLSNSLDWLTSAPH